MTRDKPPFWQWLIQSFNETYTSSFVEFFIGMMGMFLIFILQLVFYNMSSGTRVILVLLIIPSFLLMMHGVYRADT